MNIYTKLFPARCQNTWISFAHNTERLLWKVSEILKDSQKINQSM